MNDEQRVIIQMDTPLPCAMRDGDGVCAAPATVAWCWRQEHATVWQAPGLWLLQPRPEGARKACTEKMMKVYEVK